MGIENRKIVVPEVGLEATAASLIFRDLLRMNRRTAA